ncbi:MAG: hypothetical protein M3268_00645 [Acidobacteriota bacterium]|nr:hypothetical protein [Acidobacteriota bacterium]
MFTPPDDLSNEARAAVNQTLNDFLGNEWGEWDFLLKYLRDEHHIDTDLADLAYHAPCLIEMLTVGALARNGEISRYSLKIIRQIIHNLIRIAYRADKGEENAINQFKALHKIAYPHSYELPATVIENLVTSYHTSPHLARAWSIRDRMIDLAYVVRPARKGASVLEGAVTLTTKPNLMTHPMYQRAASLIKPQSTLQSLAIAIYTEDLDREGIKIDTRQLKADLQKLREWEAANPWDEDEYVTLFRDLDEPKVKLPPVPIYSQGWKQKWRRGDKK